MTTDITTILFLLIMEGSCVNYKYFARSDLIITFVTGKYVDPNNAVDGLLL